jgi:hypothetical protein
MRTYVRQRAAAHGCEAEALRVLEWAGVLTWQHRIARIREACTDLFGRTTWRWRVNSPLERALARFGAAWAAKEGIEQEASG